MPKWVQAGQVSGLFAEAPAQVIAATVPPPLPVERTEEPTAAVPTPDGLKLPVVGMSVVSGLALFFGLIGVLDADHAAVRVLLAVGIAHNLAALALTGGVARLRGYALASVSPWVVMTCWLWHWLTNPLHGVTLLGMALAASAGVWALLVLRRPGVRLAFDADPPLPPLFGGRQAPAHTPDPGTRFPWPVEERSAPNPKLFWLKAGIAASVVVGVLLLVTVVAAIFCLPFFSLACLIYFFGVSKGRLHGRWVPVEGAGWVEFLPGGILKREDGTVGTFALLPNQRFIDLLVSGHLVDSWKVLAWGTDTLEVQDVAGRARSFKKGKTLEEKQANPFRRERTTYLPNSWTPIDGSGEWVQFTGDGAVVFSDGTAGRYAVSGEEPDEVIRVKMSGGSAREFRVLSLSRSQLVIEEGAVARSYRPAGRKQSGQGEAAEPATEGEGPVLGNVLSSAWNWLSGKEACVSCKSRNTELQGRNELRRWQEVKTDYGSSTPNHRVQAVFNCYVHEEHHRCKDCGHQWVVEREGSSPA
jgi:hypothetical protein